MREDKKYFKTDWMEFHPLSVGCKFKIARASYFDDRLHFNFMATSVVSFVALSISIACGGIHTWQLTFIPLILVGVGNIYLDLPFHSKIYECDPPEYGFYYFENAFVICNGKRRKFIYMPWHYEWVRTSMLLKDDTWVHETKKQRYDFWKDNWVEKRWQQVHPYTYTLKNGQSQNRMATIHVKEREWRPKWFMWTSLFKMVQRCIEIDFNDEVGERTGSWKGGVTGCSNNLRTGESPLSSLRRMEAERKFN